MKSQELRGIVSRLVQTLENESLSPQAQSLLDELHMQLDTVDNSDVESPMLTTTKALEAEFAAHHPVAERTVRELIDTLVKMGI